MKKMISLIFILFLMGCSKDNYITCNIEVNNNLQNYTMTGTYKIYYDDSYVTKVEEQEIYISSDQTMIDYFIESKNLDYYNLNDLYGGYTYKVKSSENSVTLNATIDMSLVNIKQMIKDKKLDEDYVISNRLTTSGIVKTYESKGAICDI